jgi:PAS domain S-box-containing protein
MTPSEMIAGSLIAAVISDPALPDTPIVECNDAFVTLTGYARNEILGRNCRFLTGSGTEPELTAEIRRGVRERRTILVEILNYKKDGTPFRNAVLVAPLFDDAGAIRYFLGSQIQVTREGDEKDGARHASGNAGIAALSPRQKQVLIGVASGKLNKQIAFDLSVTERTIKMHRAAMLQTLGVRTGAEAIRLAIEAGF